MADTIVGVRMVANIDGDGYPAVLRERWIEYVDKKRIQYHLFTEICSEFEEHASSSEGNYDEAIEVFIIDVAKDYGLGYQPVDAWQAGKGSCYYIEMFNQTDVDVRLMLPAGMMTMKARHGFRIGMDTFAMSLLHIARAVRENHVMIQLNWAPDMDCAEKDRRVANC